MARTSHPPASYETAAKMYPSPPYQFNPMTHPSSSYQFASTTYPSQAYQPAPTTPNYESGPTVHHSPTYQPTQTQTPATLRGRGTHKCYWEESRKSHFLEDKQIASVGVFDEVSFYTLFQALGWFLEEIHATLAHLEKKWRRLQLYTKSHEDNAYSGWRRRHS
ncbi:hypothetical protein Tco_1034491 [Tanacetum coccineum]